MIVSNQAYMDNGGNQCPLCDSVDITASMADVEYNIATQYCRCNSCGAAWADCYTFTGIDDVVDKDGNEIKVTYD